MAGTATRERPIIRVRTALAALLMLLAAGICLPAQAAGATDPFYGTLFDDSLELTRAQRGLDMDRQAAAGFGVIRHHVHWSHIEKQVGVFDFNALDEIVGDAADRGLRILPVIYDTPAFYRAPDTPQSLNRQAPPEDPAYFGRIALRLAQRYGPLGSFWCSGLPRTCRTPSLPITAWQIWNEPNFPSWWKGAADPDPAEYVELLKVAYTNLKLADPTSEVVMAGLSPSVATSRRHYLTYLSDLYKAGAAPYLDTLAIHAYAPDVAGATQVARGVRQVADANDDAAKPIWITEYGWANGGLRSPFIKTTDCQAAMMHASGVEWRRVRDELKLRGAIQFQWRDVATMSTSWPYYAGLNPAAFSDPPKPALGQLAKAIAGSPPDPAYTVAAACPRPPTPPPVSPPVPTPVPTPTTATSPAFNPQLLPALVVGSRIPGGQRPLRRRRLAVRVSCDRLCGSRVVGRLNLRRGGRYVGLGSARRPFMTGAVTLRIPVGSAARGEIRRALRAGRRVSARVSFRVRDRIGRLTTRSRTVRIRG